MLLMSSVGAFAQSETNTPLKGDLNEDGEVDAADVVVLVDIIMKKNVDTSKFYWYIGKESDGVPSSISNIQADSTVPGWHEIGTSLSSFQLRTSETPVILSTTIDKYTYYIVIPSELNLYDEDNVSIMYAFTEVTCNISGYKAYVYYNPTRQVKGVVIKE